MAQFVACHPAAWILRRATASASNVTIDIIYAMLSSSTTQMLRFSGNQPSLYVRIGI
jgi:hypothetical protein